MTPGQTSIDIVDVDSIVVDRHKHRLQPYGCGCVLFRNPDVGRFYKHDSPATYFSSAELQLGEISLECSFSGNHCKIDKVAVREEPFRLKIIIRPQSTYFDSSCLKSVALQPCK